MKLKERISVLPTGWLTYGLAGLVLLLTLFACVRQKTLLWEDTSDNENGFRIYRVIGQEMHVIGEVGPGVTRFVDQNAPAQSCYVVTAFNHSGESTPTPLVCGR